MHSLWQGDLADDHRRELQVIVQTRPRPIRTGGRLRSVLGRRLIAAGIRLCVPPRAGVPSRISAHL